MENCRLIIFFSIFGFLQSLPVSAEKVSPRISIAQNLREIQLLETQHRQDRAYSELLEYIIGHMELNKEQKAGQLRELRLEIVRRERDGSFDQTRAMKLLQSIDEIKQRFQISPSRWQWLQKRWYLVPSAVAVLAGSILYIRYRKKKAEEREREATALKEREETELKEREETERRKQEHARRARLDELVRRAHAVPQAEIVEMTDPDTFMTSHFSKIIQSGNAEEVNYLRQRLLMRQAALQAQARRARRNELGRRANAVPQAELLAMTDVDAVITRHFPEVAHVANVEEIEFVRNKLLTRQEYLAVETQKLQEQITRYLERLNQQPQLLVDPLGDMRVLLEADIQTELDQLSYPSAVLNRELQDFTQRYTQESHELAQSFRAQQAAMQEFVGRGYEPGTSPNMREENRRLTGEMNYSNRRQGEMKEEAEQLQDKIRKLRFQQEGREAPPGDEPPPAYTPRTPRVGRIQPIRVLRLQGHQ